MDELSWPSREVLVEIVDAGIWAPTADNNLQFSFDIMAAGIRLWAAPGFSLDAAGHKPLLALIAFGAIIENMCQRAAEHGWHADVELFPGDEAELVARLAFRPIGGGAGSEALARGIDKRRTNRHLWFKGPVQGAQLELLRAVGETEGQEAGSARVVWLSGKSRARALALIRIAETARFCSHPLHEELFSSIDFDRGWRASTEFKLAPGALEVEPPMRPMFKALRYWRLAKALRLLGAPYILGWRAGALPAMLAPALGLICTAEKTAGEGALAAGRAFERVWLQASIDKLVLQPLAASAVLAHAQAADLGEAQELPALLNHGWREICPGLIPLMVFRLGNGARTMPPSEYRSGRRPRASYIRQA